MLKEVGLGVGLDGLPSEKGQFLEPPVLGGMKVRTFGRRVDIVRGLMLLVSFPEVG